MAKVKWWEIGYVDYWVRLNMEQAPETTYCIVPADDDAITEEEWLARYKEVCKEEV